MAKFPISLCCGGSALALMLAAAPAAAAWEPTKPVEIVTPFPWVRAARK